MNRRSKCIKHTRHRRCVRNKHHTMKGGTEPASTPGGRFLTSLEMNNPDDYKRKYTPEGNTFIIQGHGCDTGITFEIPKNCAYYTRALCGTYVNADNIDKNFTEQFIKQDKLKNSVTKFNLHAHTYRNKNSKTIKNINYEMNHMYSNSYYELLSIFINNIDMLDLKLTWYIPSFKNKQLTTDIFKEFLQDHPYLSYSGIIEYKKHNTVDFTYMRSLYSLLFNTDEKYKIFCDKCGPNFENDLPSRIREQYNSIISEENFFSDLIDYTYKYSFFPNIEDVRTVYNNKKNTIHTIESFIKLILDNFRISQYELFKKFNGTYYNMVCRVPCKKTNIGRVYKRRRASVGSRNDTDKDSISNMIYLDHFNDITKQINGYERDKQALKILQSNNINKLQQLNTLKYNLFDAIRTDNQEIVKLLLENKKTDLNIKYKNDNAPLHYAVENDNQEMVTLLLKNGANPNIQNKTGYTPLHIAVGKDNQEMVKLLLENEKTNPNIQDNNDNVPLNSAVSDGNQETVELLLENKNTNPNIQNKFLETPLHIAVYHNQPKMVELLLNNGANPNIANERNKTPLQYARDKNRDEDIIKLLNSARNKNIGKNK